MTLPPKTMHVTLLLQYLTIHALYIFRTSAIPPKRSFEKLKSFIQSFMQIK